MAAAAAPRRGGRGVGRGVQGGWASGGACGEVQSGEARRARMGAAGARAAGGASPSRRRRRARRGHGWAEVNAGGCVEWGGRATGRGGQVAGGLHLAGRGSFPGGGRHGRAGRARFLGSWVPACVFGVLDMGANLARSEGLEESAAWGCPGGDGYAQGTSAGLCICSEVLFSFFSLFCA
ncbi:hypothetical protein BRADI_4g15375v3 [Brachypodium distachyon]|uniref:Uncharacterized protein n=1 Tax=Brachypodium distachyon TaxID=15368 RepID=A0A2K2CN28_BRADI|nr:hypothetical protein BRADI_4g15375v3 [Brachypodium distachyon]